MCIYRLLLEYIAQDVGLHRDRHAGYDVRAGVWLLPQYTPPYPVRKFDAQENLLVPESISLIAFLISQYKGRTTLISAVANFTGPPQTFLMPAREAHDP
jgi:hypothetical protein